MYLVPISDFYSYLVIVGGFEFVHRFDRDLLAAVHDAGHFGTERHTRKARRDLF